MLHLFWILLLFLQKFIYSNALDSAVWEAKDDFLFAASPIVINSEKGPLLQLHAPKSALQPVLLDLKTAASASTLIRAESAGVVTFELSAAGEMSTKSLKMYTGGIQVDAGGIQIKSGGLRVKGGLEVESGGLKLTDQSFSAARLSAVSADVSMPLIDAKATSDNYIGDLMNLEASSGDSFNFIRASNAAGDVFKVTQGGDVSTKGALTVGADAVLHGAFAVNVTRVSAGDAIMIPASALYVEIKEDRVSRRNEISFGADADAGRVVIISNLDADTTSGALLIPSNTAIMAVYTGSAWVPVDALRAPSEVLDGVTSFTARNDLHIGNVTFEAGQFRATRLPAGGVVYAGTKGTLEALAGVAVKGGVLLVQDLRAQRLAGDLDARSHTIRNALLVDATIDATAISTQSLQLRGADGVVVLKNGTLTASPEILIDKDGRLVITDIYNDVNFHSRSLRDVSIDKGSLSNIKDARIDTLFVSSAIPFSLLTVDHEYRVKSLEGISLNKGELKVSSIGSFKATGPIDANSQPMTNVAIASGSLSNLDSISSRSIRLLGQVDSKSDATSLVIMASNGELRSLQSDKLVLAGVAIGALEVTGSSDFHGTSLKDIARIETSSLHAKSIITDSITLPALAESTSCNADCEFVGADSQGRLGLIDFSKMVKSIMNTNSDYDSIQVNSIQFKDGGTGVMTMLGGAVQVSDTLTVASLDAATVNAKEALITPALTVSGVVSATVLGTDGTGKVIGVDTIDMAAITVKDLSADTLRLDSSKLATLDPSSSLLLINREGNVGLSTSIRVDSVEANKLTVLEGRIGSLTVDLIHVVHKLDAESVTGRFVEAQELKVTGLTQLHDDLAVEGSVSVAGSVIGSGPYIDSSDVRFKKNVKPISGALDSVCALNGVYFDYNREDYPARKFPEGRQVGWIADEVNIVVPDLVTEDEQGFKAVAYARATSLIAEAVKELREETANKMEFIMTELKLIREELMELKVASRSI